MNRYAFVHIPAACRFVACIASCLLAAFCTACDTDSGGVFAYSGGSRADMTSLIIIPNRREYPPVADNPVFKRRTDFTVLGVYPDGTSRIVDNAMVTVSVDNGDALQEETYTFIVAGEHFINVSYAGRSGYYAVWVQSPDTSGPKWSGDPGGITIDIVW